MDEAFLRDLVIIQDQAVEAIEAKLAEVERLRRQAKTRLKKATKRGGTLQQTESYRHNYNLACLEYEAWRRRLNIARKRRDKMASSLDERTVETG